MREGVPFFMNKIAKYRPRIVCFLAKGIWEIFLREAYRLNPPPKPTPSTPKRPRAKSAPPRMQIVASKYFSPPSCNSEVEEPATPSPSQRQRKSRRPEVPKYDFDWGLQPFKVEHRRIGTVKARPVCQPQSNNTIFQERHLPRSRQRCSSSCQAPLLELSRTRCAPHF